jgi:phosphatidylinositol alpha-mannosyltransferase
VRVAIVSPYSWTYPGGVNRHVEALTDELIGRGHELRVLAPWDPPGRLSRMLHRDPPELNERPDYLVAVGRTKAFGANGAVSNICMSPEAVVRMRRELRAFAPDVVHVHEPLVPLLAADAVSYRGAPVVGTFHTYSTKPIPNHLASLGGGKVVVRDGEVVASVGLTICCLLTEEPMA